MVSLGEERSQKDTMRGHNREESGICVGHSNRMRALELWEIPEGNYMVGT